MSSQRTDPEQAQYIFENDMMDRNFWFVTDDYDNFLILQDVLDVLFNCTEGNDYRAKYIAYQNNTKLVILCRVCQKDLPSYDPFILHNQGKPHLKAVMTRYAHKEKAPKVKKCNYLVLKDMLEPLNMFEEGSLEDRFDHTDETVVGVQFVYKETFKNESQFTCQLCMKERGTFRLSSDAMFDHVVSESHILKYIEVVHGFKGGKLSDYQDLICKDLEIRGRITCKIQDMCNETDPPIYDSLLKRHSSYSTKDSKRLKPSSSLVKQEEDATPPVRTRDMACQANDLSVQSLPDFIDELKSCVEEEDAISEVLRRTNQGHWRILANTVQAVSNSAKNSFAGRGDEFEALTAELFKMATHL